MKFSKLVSLATCACLTVSIASCSSNDKSAKTDKAKSSTSAGSTSNAKKVRVWFMEGSISDEAQKYLKTTFEKNNPGQTLEIEVQPWKGISAKLQTALASKDQSPDIVEVGSTPDKLIVAGAYQDVSDLYEMAGGKNLIPAFSEGGVFDGKRYTLPLYGGVRGVFYRKDLFKKAGLEAPKTLTELKDDAIKLQKANPAGTPNFSGIYMAATDIHALESYLYAMGGRYAVKKDGKWVGALESPESQKAIKQIQDIFRHGTHYAQDSQAGQKQFQNYFNDGKVGMLIATGNIGRKLDKKLFDEGKVGVMPLPSEKPGEIGQSYAGGSNIAIARNGLNHKGARAAIKIIYSKDFQQLLAKSGWIPGNLAYADNVSGVLGKYSKEIMQRAVNGPQTVNMGYFIRKNSLKNFWARIANMEDPMATAKELDKQFTEILNRPIKK